MLLSKTLFCFDLWKMFREEENLCCQEIEGIKCKNLEALEVEQLDHPPNSIVDHPSFRAVCLNVWVLQTAWLRV